MAETNDLASEIQELTWSLVDDQATDEQVRHLGELLSEDVEARRIYIMCMQMHADLHFMFGKKPTLPPEVQKAIDAGRANNTNRPVQPSRNSATGRKTPTPKTSAPLPLVDLSQITVNGSPAFFP